MKLRPSVAEDAPFIIDSWLRESSCNFPALWPFKTGYKRVIAAILARSEVVVLEGEDGRIQAYAVKDRELPVLHFVFVRPSHRGRGIAREVIGGGVGFASAPWPRGAIWKKMRKERAERGERAPSEKPGSLPREIRFRPALLPFLLAQQEASQLLATLGD